MSIDYSKLFVQTGRVAVVIPEKRGWKVVSIKDNATDSSTILFENNEKDDCFKWMLNNNYCYPDKCEVTSYSEEDLKLLQEFETDQLNQVNS